VKIKIVHDECGREILVQQVWDRRLENVRRRRSPVRFGPSRAGACQCELRLRTRETELACADAGKPRGRVLMQSTNAITDLIRRDQVRTDDGVRRS